MITDLIGNLLRRWEEENPYNPSFSTFDFACTVGQALKASLKDGETIEDRRAAILADAEAVREQYWSKLGASHSLGNRIIGATVGPTGFSQLAVASGATTSDSRNWLEAYVHLVNQSRYESDELGLARHDFVNDPGLLERIAPHLAAVDSQDAGLETYKIDVPAPTPQNPQAVESREFRIRRGNESDEDARFRRTFERKYLRIASPLFKWLVKQPVGSLDHKDVFLKAVEIYGDPWAAMGVISELLSRDAQTGGGRSLSAVANSRIRPLFPKMKDPAGNAYHFWGYLAPSVVTPSFRHLANAGSFLRETVIDRDSEDRASDKLAIEIADMINGVLDGRYACPAPQAASAD